MKAMLLSAGYGKRLRPITDNIPKCLVSVKNKPILEIWLENLNKVGVNSCLINTHHLSEKVKKFCEESKFKNNIVLKHEKELLGTAGTLLHNIDFYENSDGFLLHSDNYCMENLKNFIDAHNSRPKECLMTMMTFYTKNPKESGICEVNRKNILVDFNEKSENPKGNLANGAVYILSAELISLIKKKFNNSKDFSNDIISKLKNKIYCYESNKTFIDIGNIKSLNEANKSI